MDVLKIKSICVLAFASLLFFACENHVQEDELTEVEEFICDPNTSFTNSIKPIIDAKCVSCHGGSQSPNLSTYNRVKNNANSIKAEVTSRRMPQGGFLSNEQIELISCWIDSGALNN